MCGHPTKENLRRQGCRSLKTEIANTFIRQHHNQRWLAADDPLAFESFGPTHASERCTFGPVPPAPFGPKKLARDDVSVVKQVTFRSEASVVQ